MDLYLRLSPEDNVAVALTDLDANTVLTVDGHPLAVIEPVRRGHKFALKHIQKGENVIKYSFPIGHSTAEIKAGAWVHVHNLKTNLSDTLSYTYQPKQAANPYHDEQRTFMGYPRSSGEVGIRNELWVLPTVGCINSVAQHIIVEFRSKYPQVAEQLDSVASLPHSYGCSQLGEDHENTKHILAHIAKHPNAGGVLILALGCENNCLSGMVEALGDYDSERIRFLHCQDTEDEISEGVQILHDLAVQMQSDTRQSFPLSRLRIGMKCGGSDGLSGITANPLLGMLSDYLIAQGATTVLTEVPEMFGGETILMDRAKDEATFRQIVDMINDFKEYFLSNGQSIYENPSPGNKEGGISTLEDKSLGCIQKGGTAQVTDVLGYTDTLSASGLNLLSAPGNDLVASTALGAAGCHMVLFSTGRGTPYATFVPTVKVATNEQIYKKKPHWMDFNAADVFNSGFDAVLRTLIDEVLSLASGKHTLSEQQGYKEIAIFKTGVTL